MKINIHNCDMAPVYGEPFFLIEDDLEHIDYCPACSYKTEQTEISVVEGSEKRGLALAACGHCSHIYLSTRPSQKWFQEYYSSEWDKGRSTTLAPFINKIKSWLRHRTWTRQLFDSAMVLQCGFLYLVTQRSHQVRALTMLSGIGNVNNQNSTKLPIKLLDIGCGYGTSLRTFRDAGFEVYGTEASAHRVEQCRAQGFEVIQTEIVDFSPVVKYGPFDVVYSTHVFEHITDLDAFMSALKPIVALGGLIYIEVPHSQMAENIMHRSHVPVHCHLFSGHSLSTLLNRFGFQVARVQMDINLHIVAIHTNSSSEFPSINVASEYSVLSKGLTSILPDHGIVNIEYDHYRMFITSTHNSEVIYKNPHVYSVERLNREGSEKPVNSIIAKADGADDCEWPIRFIHDTPIPPMWLKRQ
jgi:2-polyprenyl-3-methyl-5-hydroxy-6-metoxy-1,4-benzoquinol methylase